MNTFSKFILLIILLSAGTACFYRYFHKLAKFETKISQVNIVPDYLMHKDSIHYSLTFKINNYKNRVGIYLGNKDKVLESKIANQLDTVNIYKVFLDETVPTDEIGIIGVKKILLNDKRIYQESQLMYLFIGIAFVFVGLGIFLRRTLNKNNVS